MTLLEVDHAANIIRQSVNPDANIIFGSLIDETLQGKLKISIFATGIEASGKKILYHPESLNNSGFSSIQYKIDEGLSYEKTDILSKNDISNVVEDNPSISESEEFNLTNERAIREKDEEETKDDIKENSDNYDNFEEKKKNNLIIPHFKFIIW